MHSFNSEKSPPQSKHKMNLYNTKEQDSSLVSRLKDIQQNKQRIKAKLNRLNETDYVPSSIDNTSLPSGRKYSASKIGESRRPNSKFGKSSNDFDKIEINKPNMLIYHNNIGQDSSLVNKLKNGGAQKMGINQLNELRLQIHDKQQMLLKRKFIYRETQATAPQDLDKVMQMNQLDLDQAIKDTNLDIDDYRNPIPKQLILNSLPKIKKNAQQRLKIFKDQFQIDTSQQTKKYNKAFLARQNPKTLKIASQILDEIVNSAVGYYEALSHKLGLNKLDNLNDRKNDKQGINDLIVQKVYSDILSNIMQQFHQQIHEEVSQLQQLADDKLEQIFGQGYEKYQKQWEKKVIKKYKCQLNYQDQPQKQEEYQQDDDEDEQQSQSQYSSVQNSSFYSSQYSNKKNKIKKKQHQTSQQSKNPNNKKLNKSNKNPNLRTRPMSQSQRSDPRKSHLKNNLVRQKAKPQPKSQVKKPPINQRLKNQVPRSQSSLSQDNSPVKQSKKSDKNTEKVNKKKDVVLMTKQQKQDFLKIQRQYFEKIQVDYLQITDRTFDSNLIFIQDGIYLISPKFIRNIKEQVIAKIPIQNIIGFKKFNYCWALFNQTEVSIINLWYEERLNVHYGSRPKKLADKISYIQFYPVTTILGIVTSILIAFENGIIVKYNFNRDNLSGKQSDHEYQALVPHKNLSTQPSLPSQFKGELPPKSNKRQYQIRQFFDFHDKKIIGMHFYSIVQFISIDVSLTCALWNCIDQDITPVDTFVIDDVKSCYRRNKNKSNPIKLKDTEQEMYKQYFKTKNGLKNQIFDDPQKGQAYYLPEVVASGVNAPLWKIYYKNERITKIVQQNFDQKTNTPKALSSCLWNSNLFILTQRFHVVQQDMKTYRVICWNIGLKIKKKIHYQIHLKKSEKPPMFLISDSVLISDNQLCPALIFLHPGKVMLFSLLTGQFIRNIGDLQIMDDPLTFYHFATAANTAIVLVGDSGIHRMSFDDKNLLSVQQKYFKGLKEVLNSFMAQEQDDFDN